MLINENEKDTLLWSRFKEGDAGSFTTIFRNYYTVLYNYGCKITRDTTLVEDAIEDLFMDLWQSKGKAEIISLKSYLLAAFKFKLIKSIAKAGKISSYDSGRNETDFEISTEMFVINNENNEELKEKVFKAINELSARQKEIIYLKFNQNLSYDEISEIMHINYQAARNLLSQAIKVLRKIMIKLIILIPLIKEF